MRCVRPRPLASTLASSASTSSVALCTSNFLSVHWILAVAISDLGPVVQDAPAIRTASSLRPRALASTPRGARAEATRPPRGAGATAPRRRCDRPAAPVQPLHVERDPPSTHTQTYLKAQPLPPTAASEPATESSIHRRRVHVQSRAVGALEPGPLAGDLVPARALGREAGSRRRRLDGLRRRRRFERVQPRNGGVDARARGLEASQRRGPVVGDRSDGSDGSDSARGERRREHVR